MKHAHIAYSGTEMDYRRASMLAAALANEDASVIEPVLVAWYDRKADRMSPPDDWGGFRTQWHDYGASHGGRLEVDVGDDYMFIYADSSAFDPYEASPYSNLSDAQGNEYLCQISLLGDSRMPMPEACVPLDEWTSKLT